MRFRYPVKIDSRTILDQSGAETLLGHGDMLYLPSGTAIPERIHGAFVSDDEVHRIVKHIKNNSMGTDYVEGVLSDVHSLTSDTLVGGSRSLGGTSESNDIDSLYDEAVRIVTESRRASISSVQRKLKVGYNRAARMVEAMEQDGIVSAQSHNGDRTVLAPPPPSIE